MRKLFTIASLATMILLPSLMAQDYVITTVAGSMPVGSGGPVSKVYLRGPEAVTMDNAGNVYIADSQHHRVYKIDPTGTATLVIGKLMYGTTAGDKGPAANASIGIPSGMVFDSKGNLYIADRNQHRIRKIDSKGVVTTYAGFGDGRFVGDGRAATLADLNAPRGLAVDSNDNLYLADTSNNRIRKVDAETGIITTVAGTTSGFAGDGGPARKAKLKAPEDVVFDSDGNMYIADTGNNRIRMVNTKGIISTIAGTGVDDATGDGFRAEIATLNAPAGVQIDGNGNLWVADRKNNRLRMINLSTGMISTPIGAFSSNRTPGIKAPNRIFIDKTSGRIYIPESASTDTFGTDQVQVYHPDRGLVGRFVGAPRMAQSGQVATEAVLSDVFGVAVDTQGDIYFSEPANNRVMKVDKTGYLSVLAGTGVSGAAGDRGPAEMARLKNPTGLAVDTAGNLYIADTGNNRIRMVTQGGTITTVVGPGLTCAPNPSSPISRTNSPNLNGSAPSGYAGDGLEATDCRVRLKAPRGVAVDRVGNLYVADTGNHIVRKVALSGKINTFAGQPGASGNAGDGGAALDAYLNYPTFVAVDATGRRVWIGDGYTPTTEKDRSNAGNAAVRMVEDGVILSYAGVGGTSGDNAEGTNAWLRRMRQPGGIAMDSAGNLYISDTKNMVVRQVNTSMKATNFAGTKSNNSNWWWFYSGDGGPANKARLCQPAGLAISANDDLFIADQCNGLIRKVSKQQ